MLVVCLFQSVQSWNNCRPSVLHFYAALRLFCAHTPCHTPYDSSPGHVFFSRLIKLSCVSTWYMLLLWSHMLGMCFLCSLSLSRNISNVVPSSEKPFLVFPLPTVFSPHCFRLSNLAPSTLLFIIYVQVCQSFSLDSGEIAVVHLLSYLTHLYGKYKYYCTKCILGAQSIAA